MLMDHADGLEDLARLAEEVDMDFAAKVWRLAHRCKELAEQCRP